MTDAKKIALTIYGIGGVGKCLLAQLPLLLEKFPNVKLCTLASSKRTLGTGSWDKPISLDTWEVDLAAAEGGNGKTPAAPSVQVVAVDVTSSPDIAANYALWLGHGISVVTANKKAFSGPHSSWKQLQSPKQADPTVPLGLLYHESSVGAGLPIISTIKDLLQTGDEIQKVEGVFSGTMSFLFNSFAPAEGQGGKWSTEVKKAKDLGYTEPDPRDDLNGVDVARKAVILARLAGVEIEDTNSFPVESLIPKALENVSSSDEYMTRLPEYDEGMENVKAEAEKENKVVRFVGSVDVVKKRLKVGLENFEKGHPIASLKGSDNIFVFHTKRYSKNPLVIQGAGAGGEVTAMGVMADLLKVIERLS